MSKKKPQSSLKFISLMIVLTWVKTEGKINDSTYVEDSSLLLIFYSVGGWHEPNQRD